MTVVPMDLTTKDSNQPRLIVIVPWELPGSWETWRARLEPGPVVVRATDGARVTYDADGRGLRGPLRRRLLDDSVRRHLVHPEPLPLHVSSAARHAHDQPRFQDHAWDVLHVETLSVGPGQTPVTRALIALHLAFTEPSRTENRSWATRLVRERAGRDEISRHVRARLGDGHGYGLDDANGHKADLFTIAYVPQGLVGGDRLASARDWGELPRQGAPDVGPDKAALHTISPVWSAYAGTHGLAVCQYRRDRFLPLVHFSGRYLDAVLLMRLQHHRATSLMERLAAVAMSTEIDDEERVNEVIALDTEAVRFVVTEQWSTMTDSERPINSFLTFLLDAYGIPEAIEETRDQAHRLRENALMVIGRAEQKAEEDRARSSRAMEIALSFLAFVGMPLTVFLDVWTNWEADEGVGKRSSALAGVGLPWGAILVLGVVGAVLIGGALWRGARWLIRKRLDG